MTFSASQTKIVPSRNRPNVAPNPYNQIQSQNSSRNRDHSHDSNETSTNQQESPLH